MIRLALSLACVLLASACATGPQPKRSLNDPAVQKLYALPVPEFYATFAVAKDLASRCGEYRYDAALEQVLDARRQKDEGQLSVIRARDGVVLMRDVVTREFQARHGVSVATDDICPALAAEYDEGSALSAPLVRR